MNIVTLIGRVGKTPDVKRTSGGIAVATFSLATSKRWKDKNGEKQEQTQWHNIVSWRGAAEVAEKYVKKGDMLAIKGEITYRRYEKDGNTRYITEIVAEDIELLTPKSNSEGQGATPQHPGQDYNKAKVGAEDYHDIDDLPF